MTNYVKKIYPKKTRISTTKRKPTKKFNTMRFLKSAKRGYL